MSYNVYKYFLKCLTSFFKEFLIPLTIPHSHSCGYNILKDSIFLFILAPCSKIKGYDNYMNRMFIGKMLDLRLNIEQSLNIFNWLLNVNAERKRQNPN